MCVKLVGDGTDDGADEGAQEGHAAIDDSGFRGCEPQLFHVDGEVG